MKIFTDFHHAGLLQSLILLFESRFGGEVYRPIGMEWHDKGFWAVFDHPATAAQYLGVGSATPDGSPKLNEVIKKEAFVYHCNDIDSGETNRAITFDGFCKLNFDFVIASLPQHIPLFRKLINEYKPDAKLIYQIGNAWNISPEEEAMIDGIMSSARVSYAGNKPFVQYHQEFDTKNVFTPDLPATNWRLPPLVRSFVNCFDTQDHFSADWKLFQEVEQIMKLKSSEPWTFEALGGGCRDGAAHGSIEVARKMKESRFIWHTKFGGDGFGHVLFSAAAVGRPMIVNRQYYVDKLGEKLLIDGETCINIEGLSPAEIVRRIEFFSDPTQYHHLCRRTYENFKAHVDYESEAKQIEKFLADLL